MGLIDEFKRGYAGDESRHFRVAGTQVRCSHCNGVDFELGSGMLNTPGLTFLNLDWANRTADLLICVKCSHVEWFLEKPERI